MSRSHGRLAFGLFAGVAIGVVVEPLFFWPIDSAFDPGHFILRFYHIRLPCIWPAALGASCAIVAAIVGGVEVHGLPRHLIAGTLAGVVLGGVVIGGFVFPAIAIHYGNDVFPSKAIASYRLAGISMGSPFGALCGFLIGLGYHFRSRYKATLR